MTEPLELLVVEGQKQGARTPISESELTSVGNDYDCDVMLGLPGIEHALALTNSEGQQKSPVDYPKLEMKQHEGRLLLRVVRGNIQVGEKVLAEGDQSELLPDTQVTLGDSVFIAGPTSALQTVKNELNQKAQLSQEDQPDLSDSQGQDIAAANADTSIAETAEQTDMASSNAKPRKRGFSFMNAVAVLCVVVGGVVTYLNYDQSNKPVEPDAAKSVAAELERGGFSGLSVALLENDAVLVDGFLESRAELYEARNLLQSTSNTSIEWDVQLGETLVDSVQSVFQVNGVEATVESVASGSVLVQTQSDDLALLERTEKIAYADVANLEHLELVNTVPVVAEETELENNSVDSLPGKRIVLIVKDEYILTEDGSVYYTGSVLPSGHKVLAILDKKIQVELNDSQIELTF